LAADATRLKKKAQLKEYKGLAQQLREEISSTATQLDAGAPTHDVFHVAHN
jgi:hypothetical protein